MLHARSRAEGDALLSDLARRAAISDRQVLYSTKEYKRSRLPYFTDEFAAWERANLTSGPRLADRGGAPDGR
jgi:hypothetical protein